MFKVPEWGNDVPDTKINFEKTSQKKKNNKLIAQLPQESPISQVNGIHKTQPAKKSTDKRKLKRIRQKNRQIYEKLSNTQNHEPDVSQSIPGRFVLNPNKVDYTENISVNKDPPKKHKTQRNQKHKPNNIPNGTKSSNEVKKPVKHKFDKSNERPNAENIELQNIDTDKYDEIIVNAKKKKLNDAFKDEDREDVLFSEKAAEVNIDAYEKKKNSLLSKKQTEKPLGKVDRKKKLIRQVLEGQNSHRNSVNMSGNSQSLRERMLAKLQAAQFRYLNEKLYTSSGSEAKQLFQADLTAFETYHRGYQQQIKKWPVNPLDVIVKRIMKMPRTHLIADMGCGSASLAQMIPHNVRSFDLVATTPAVEACDMAHTPLLGASVDVVVYCLALMGTELVAYLAEGNRVLKIGGRLLIAEVESRFDKLEDFTHGVERLGFKLVKADQSHKVFYFMEFRKIQEAPKKAKHLALTLKPCLYKRR